MEPKEGENSAAFVMRVEVARRHVAVDAIGQSGGPIHKDVARYGHLAVELICTDPHRQQTTKVFRGACSRIGAHWPRETQVRGRYIDHAGVLKRRACLDQTCDEDTGNTIIVTARRQSETLAEVLTTENQ